MNNEPTVPLDASMTWRPCPVDSVERRLCEIVAKLRPLYATEGADRPDALLHDYPNPSRVIEALRLLVDVMFPGREQSSELCPEEFGIYLMRRLGAAWHLLRPEIERAIPFRWKSASAPPERRSSVRDTAEEARRVLETFFERLPEVRAFLIEDVRAAYDGDPAALTYAEVQLAYPGLLAITVHRLAHELYLLDVPIIPRVMSEWAHARTGVDIHPGAVIGHGFFIDHATGVVIGETARIGNRVKIYQGVTLGAKSFPLDAEGRPIKRIRRHPTVGDDVVIYANATILGGDTVIGSGSTIGGNVFLMESVPPNSLVIGEHARLMVKRDETNDLPSTASDTSDSSS